MPRFFLAREPGNPMIINEFEIIPSFKPFMYVFQTFFAVLILK